MNLINWIRRLIAPKELKEKEQELYMLKQRIMESMYWCAADSPEIGFAMLRLLKNDKNISLFRDDIRAGRLTFAAYKKKIDKEGWK